MPEHPTAAPEYRDPYDFDFDHAACLHQPKLPQENVAALRKLAEDMLNPEVYGFSVTADVRDAARRALGLPAEEVETLAAIRHGAQKCYTQDEVDAIIARQSGK